MSYIPDSLLIDPAYVARQIENAYREGVADIAHFASYDGPSLEAENKIWEASIAKCFSESYQRIARKRQ